MESLLTLRGRAFELDGIVNNFLNALLAQAVPTCLETTIIIPLLKKFAATCLNDYSTFTLKKLVMSQIKANIPKTLGPTGQNDPLKM